MTDFVLKNTESKPDGIKRIIGSQIDFALYNLEQNIDKDFDESVHEARKCSKRIRAVLRLIQYEIGDELFKKENYHYRDINRYLSEVRDITVVIEMFNNLIKDKPEPDSKELINNLINCKDKLIGRFFAEEDRLTVVLNLLGKGRQRVKTMPVKKDDINVLFIGFISVFELCKKCMNIARKAPTTENLHEWRKQAKYLYYQSQVLEPFLPDELIIIKSKLDKLAEYLGEDHDLAELGNFLNSVSDIYPANSEMNKLKTMINNCRIEKQAAIFSLADEIFDKKTEKHINNLISN